MLNLTQNELLDFLKSNDFSPEVQKETDQIYLIFKGEQREYPLFFRIFQDSYQLQLMLFVPSHLKKRSFSSKSLTTEQKENEKNIGEVARMLHAINKEIDLPGFGMDEETSLIFYRLVMPAKDKMVDPHLLLEYIRVSEQVIKLFAIPIEAVSTGKTTFADILAKAKKA